MSNRSYDEVIKEIRKVVKEEIKSYFEEPPEPNPYRTLEKWNKDAVEKIKKDFTDALGKKKRSVNFQNKLRAKSYNIDKMVDEVIGLIEEIREEERKKGTNLDNPLTESKIFRYLPWLKNFTKRADRKSNNWLGLLFVGIGLTFIARGFWDASEEMFSIQGSIITGAFTLSLLAWMERRRIFSLFGQE